MGKNIGGYYNNTSATIPEHTIEIKKMVGHNAAHTVQTEENWKIGGKKVQPRGIGLAILAVSALISIVQFALDKADGGMELNTKQEQWNEATEKTQIVKVKLEPGKKVNVWQYRLGLKGIVGVSSTDVLLSTYVEVTTSDDP